MVSASLHSSTSVTPHHHVSSTPRLTTQNTLTCHCSASVLSPCQPPLSPLCAAAAAHVKPGRPPTHPPTHAHLPPRTHLPHTPPSLHLPHTHTSQTHTPPTYTHLPHTHTSPPPPPPGGVVGRGAQRVEHGRRVGGHPGPRVGVAVLPHHAHRAHGGAAVARRAAALHLVELQAHGGQGGRLRGAAPGGGGAEGAHGAGGGGGKGGKERGGGRGGKGGGRRGHT